MKPYLSSQKTRGAPVWPRVTKKVERRSSLEEMSFKTRFFISLVKEVGQLLSLFCICR
jgi:hypothetical protein